MSKKHGKCNHLICLTYMLLALIIEGLEILPILWFTIFTLNIGTIYPKYWDTLTFLPYLS